MEPLASTPGTPVGPDGGLLHGLTAGSVRVDPVAVGPRQGRVRRWRYAAAGARDLQVGAAIADLGFAATAFAWVARGGSVATWEERAPLGRGAWVGADPAATSGWRRRGQTLLLDGDGGIRADLVTRSGRVRIDVSAAPGTVPATLVTGTPAGGWNATEKAAGYAVGGTVSVADADLTLDGHGWRDWTAGRQDRHTTWRWAAGGGTTADGRAVGLNLSTGMNASGAGEDVVWLDGTPHALPSVRLGPSGDDPARSWDVLGEGWSLRFEPHGVRAAEERLPLVRSRYVQPIGTFHGTLPDPEGGTMEVELVGVTEEHEAAW